MTDVVSSPRMVTVKNWQYITEEERTLPVHDETNSGITVRSDSGAEVYVTSASVDAALLTKYGLLPGVTFDFTVPGFSTGHEAEVSFPLPAGMDPTFTLVYYVNGDQLELVPSHVDEKGNLVFTVTHFSMYTAATVDPANIEWDPTTSDFFTVDPTGLNLTKLNGIDKVRM